MPVSKLTMMMMTKMSFLRLAALPCLVFLSAGRGIAVGAEEIQWRAADSLEVEGRGWPGAATPYDRLPDSAKGKVSSVAWQQSRESAGLCIRFTTDAAEVNVRWSLVSSSLAMPHMPATGCSGVDLYARSEKSGWRFIGNGRPGKQEGNTSKFEFPDGSKSGRECLLYLPLYNGTKSLEIGVKTGAHLELPPPRLESRRPPLVIYGTSITQGGCASRPGMAWTSILGRMLDRPVINLGFSSSGSMEPPVGEVLAELDPAAYVIDCTWNMGDSQEVYLTRSTKLVETLRKAHPLTPILFVGQSLIRPEAHPTDLSKRQENAVLSLQKAGVSGLTMIPGNDLIGDDGEGTVDGVHLNDLGMERQAKALFPVISQALNGK